MNTTQSINSCKFLGQLTANASEKFREFDDGGAVLTLSIEIKTPSEKRDGEKYDRKDFAQIIVRGELAKKYAVLQKGDAIEVECQLQSRSYESKTGEKRWTTEFLACEIVRKLKVAA